MINHLFKRDNDHDECAVCGSSWPPAGDTISDFIKCQKCDQTVHGSCKRMSSMFLSCSDATCKQTKTIDGILAVRLRQVSGTLCGSGIHLYAIFKVRALDLAMRTESAVVHEREASWMQTEGDSFEIDFAGNLNYTMRVEIWNSYFEILDKMFYKLDIDLSPAALLTGKRFERWFPLEHVSDRSEKARVLLEMCVIPRKVEQPSMATVAPSPTAASSPEKVVTLVSTATTTAAAAAVSHNGRRVSFPNGKPIEPSHPSTLPQEISTHQQPPSSSSAMAAVEALPPVEPAVVVVTASLPERSTSPPALPSSAVLTQQEALAASVQAAVPLVATAADDRQPALPLTDVVTDEESHLRLSDLCREGGEPEAAAEQISLASIDLVDVADTSLSLDSEALLDDVRDLHDDHSSLDEDDDKDDEDASEHVVAEEKTLSAVTEDPIRPESTPPTVFPSFSTRPIDAPVAAVPLPPPPPSPPAVETATVPLTTTTVATAALPATEVTPDAAVASVAAEDATASVAEAAEATVAEVAGDTTTNSFAAFVTDSFSRLGNLLYELETSLSESRSTLTDDGNAASGASLLTSEASAAAAAAEAADSQEDHVGVLTIQVQDLLWTAPTALPDNGYLLCVHYVNKAGKKRQVKRPLARTKARWVTKDVVSVHVPHFRCVVTIDIVDIARDTVVGRARVTAYTVMQRQADQQINAQVYGAFDSLPLKNERWRPGSGQQTDGDDGVVGTLACTVSFQEDLYRHFWSPLVQLSPNSPEEDLSLERLGVHLLRFQAMITFFSQCYTEYLRVMDWSDPLWTATLFLLFLYCTLYVAAEYSLSGVVCVAVLLMARAWYRRYTGQFQERYLSGYRAEESTRYMAVATLRVAVLGYRGPQTATATATAVVAATAAAATSTVTNALGLGFFTTTTATEAATTGAASASSSTSTAASASSSTSSAMGLAAVKVSLIPDRAMAPSTLPMDSTSTSNSTSSSDMSVALTAKDLPVGVLSTSEEHLLRMTEDSTAAAGVAQFVSSFIKSADTAASRAEILANTFDPWPVRDPTTIRAMLRALGGGGGGGSAAAAATATSNQEIALVYPLLQPVKRKADLLGGGSSSSGGGGKKERAASFASDTDPHPAAANNSSSSGGSPSTPSSFTDRPAEREHAYYSMWTTSTAAVKFTCLTPAATTTTAASFLDVTGGSGGSGGNGTTVAVVPIRDVLLHGEQTDRTGQEFEYTTWLRAVDDTYRSSSSGSGSGSGSGGGSDGASSVEAQVGRLTAAMNLDAALLAAADPTEALFTPLAPAVSSSSSNAPSSSGNGSGGGGGGGGSAAASHAADLLVRVSLTLPPLKRVLSPSEADRHVSDVLQRIQRAALRDGSSDGSDGSDGAGGGGGGAGSGSSSSSSSSASSTLAMLWHMRDHVKNAQNTMASILDAFESFKNLFNWTSPVRTLPLFLALVALWLLTVLVPGRLLVLLVGLYEFLYVILPIPEGNELFIRFQNLLQSIPNDDDLMEIYAAERTRRQVTQTLAAKAAQRAAVLNASLRVRWMGPGQVKVLRRVNAAAAAVSSGGGISHAAVMEWQAVYVMVQGQRIAWWNTADDLDRGKAPIGQLLIGHIAGFTQVSPIDLKKFAGNGGSTTGIFGEDTLGKPLQIVVHIDEGDAAALFKAAVAEQLALQDHRQR